MLLPPQTHPPPQITQIASFHLLDGEYISSKLSCMKPRNWTSGNGFESKLRTGKIKIFKIT